MPGPWTSEHRAKFEATIAARRAQRTGRPVALPPPRRLRAPSQRDRLSTIEAKLDVLAQTVAYLQPGTVGACDHAALIADVRRLLREPPRVIVIEANHRRLSDGGLTLRAQRKQARLLALAE